MSETLIQTLGGTEAILTGGTLEDLAARIDGEILRPGAAGYDDARSIWNAMIDRRPAVIVRCRSADDVQHAVRFAADHELLLSIRGGGHNIAGNAVCDRGVMVDLSAMRTVRVDASARSARVDPGCTLGDLDAATQEAGLATPVGINSTTGVAGLTLGGGFGWLSRKHGMTIDNLQSAEIVTADGRRRRVSAAEEPDLFWAIRGGGGNFGVVTSFQLGLHPVGPEVLAGLIVHPLDAAPEVLRFYRDFVAAAPDELAVWTVMRKAPPLPFLPEEWHGREVLVLAAFYAGETAEGERALRPLRELGSPIADVIGPSPYAGWQQAFDPLLTPGARNYWKSHDFLELSDEVIDAALDAARRLPSDECEVFFGQVGGAMSRVSPTATAYANRNTNFIMNVHGRWADPSQDEACIAWSRRIFEATAPYATGSVYVNFLTADEHDRVPAAYGPNAARLSAVKRSYDPDNLFRMNQNIRPASEA